MKLDVEGHFWRPDRPDRKMAGRLRFDPTDGAILSIIEPSLSLDSLDVRLDGDAVRLLGIAGSQVLTLEQCYLFDVSQQLTGMFQRRYKVAIILSGAHFELYEPIDFRSVTVQLGNLVQWVGRYGLSVNDRLNEDSGKFFGIKYEPVSSIETNVDDGAIAVTFPWKCRRSLERIMLEQGCAIEYRFHEPQPLMKLLGVSASLRNLVTTCVHAPATVLDVKLTHPDLDRPIDLYTKWTGIGSTAKQDTVPRAKMAFTFDHIGGVDGIRSWLDSSDRYSELVAMLVSHWYAPTLYEEQRYFNSVVAAEMFVRIRRNKQNIKLHLELRDIARDIKDLFEPLVGDIDTWSSEVVQVRKKYVVHPGLRGNIRGQQLYLLSESIYILVVLTILRECGVSIGSLNNIQKHDHYKWLAAQLRSWESEGDHG